MIKRNGFTIVELLITIAIVGITATISITTYISSSCKSEAKAKGLDVSLCQSSTGRDHVSQYGPFLQAEKPQESVEAVKNPLPLPLLYHIRCWIGASAFPVIDIKTSHNLTISEPGIIIIENDGTETWTSLGCIQKKIKY